MPRLSANLGFLWAELPLLDRIAAAARAGFGAVEFHWPYDTPAPAVAEALRANGLAAVALNTRFGEAGRGEFGLGALPGREAEFRAAADEAIGYARTIGARAVHAIAGVSDAADRAAARATFVVNLRAAAERAPDLVFLVEAMNGRDRPGYLCDTIERAAAVVAATGRVNVRLLFDVYHVAVAQGDVLTRLRRHVDRIGHVQIAAVPSRAEPDEGEISYAAIFAELDRLGYGGWVGCEYRPRTTTDAGLGWIGRLERALAERPSDLS